MNRAFLAAKVAHNHYILARCHWMYAQPLQDHLVASYNSGPLAAMLIAPGGMASIAEYVKIPTGKYNKKGLEITKRVKAPDYFYDRFDGNGCLHFQSLRGVRNYLKTAEHYTSHLWDGERWIMQPAP